MKPLVIGYGNPLRGDDGVGWRVAEALAVALPEGTADVLAVHQLTPELSDPISHAAMVVFIDAAADGEVGRVACFELGGDDAGSQPALQGSHQMSPDTLLAMAEALFGRRPVAYLVTIAGESFDLSEALSPVVEAAVLVAVAAVLTEIEKRAR